MFIFTIDEYACPILYVNCEIDYLLGRSAHMSLFISHPLLALLLGVLFAAGFFHHRRRLQFRLRRFLLFAALVWIAYGIYDFCMERKIERELPPGDVPIRIDVAILYPALVTFTIAGVAVYIVGFRRQKAHSSEHDNAA